MEDGTSGKLKNMATPKKFTVVHDKHTHTAPVIQVTMYAYKYRAALTRKGTF